VAHATRGTGVSAGARGWRWGHEVIMARG
jgi:hypothetical protein